MLQTKSNSKIISYSSSTCSISLNKSSSAAFLLSSLPDSSSAFLANSCRISAVLYATEIACRMDWRICVNFESSVKSFFCIRFSVPVNTRSWSTVSSFMRSYSTGVRSDLYDTFIKFVDMQKVCEYFIYKLPYFISSMSFSSSTRRCS